MHTTHNPLSRTLTQECCVDEPAGLAKPTVGSQILALLDRRRQEQRHRIRAEHVQLTCT